MTTKQKDAQQQAPRVAYTLHTRVSGRKLAITTSSGQVAYYILVPPAWAMRWGKNGRKLPPRHAGSWLAVLHRGDNPKYHAESEIIGMVRRGSWWTRVRFTGGAGVAGVVRNDERAKALKAHERAQKVRRFFRKSTVAFDWPEETLLGKTEETKMVHVKHRRYELAFKGEEYVVTGTRRYSKMKKLKGVASAVKIVRMRDGACVAALDKGGKAGERVEGCGNVLGRVDIYEDGGGEEWELQMLLCLWGMVQGEQEKRQVVWDILMEIAENADGGG